MIEQVILRLDEEEGEEDSPADEGNHDDGRDVIASASESGAQIPLPRSRLGYYPCPLPPCNPPPAAYLSWAPQYRRLSQAPHLSPPGPLQYPPIPQFSSHTPWSAQSLPPQAQILLPVFPHLLQSPQDLLAPPLWMPTRPSRIYENASHPNMRRSTFNDVRGNQTK